MLQLQYWELSLAELEDSSLGLELSTFFQHVGYNAATEILRQEVKSFQPQSHSSSLPSSLNYRRVPNLPVNFYLRVNDALTRIVMRVSSTAFLWGYKPIPFVNLIFRSFSDPTLRQKKFELN